MSRARTTDVVSVGLDEVLRRFAKLTGGEVSGTIPELSRADPDHFGLALVSMDGHRYQAGDHAVPFTVQSVSKPFVYALALADLGLEELSRWVRAEPSGDAFNAISLEHGTGRPANPMVNAGAIATTALVRAADPAERFARILRMLGAFAGRDLDVDEATYRSEAATGDRNRALGFLMHAAGTLAVDPMQATDTYFRQCSVRVTAADLAVMAATLANGGLNPVTGLRVVPTEVSVQVLSVMASCGMYDAAGDWLLRVGLPAKSGISGGLVAASPGRFGVAVYSPPLDHTGSSVRGVAVVREMSERFGLHLLRAPAGGVPTLTAASTAAEEPSDTERAPADAELLAREGDRVVLVGARGALDFTAAERVLHALHARVPKAAPGWVILDLTSVVRVERAAEVMLRGAARRIVEAGHRVHVVAAPWAPGGAGHEFGTVQEARRACEDALLAAARRNTPPKRGR